MPPRTGQLDQISESIGEIRAYVHAGRHDIANLTQIVNALDAAQVKRHADLKAEVKAEIQSAITAMRSEMTKMAERLSALEEFRQREDGSKSVWKWLIATLIAFAAVVAGFWRH
jgi:anti-sigma-K factor RskA